MTVETSTVGAEFRVGRVFARSFSTMFRNIVPFGSIALILISPTYVFLMLTEAGDSGGYGGNEMRDSSLMVVLFIADILLGSLVAAVLAYGTIQDLGKVRVNVIEGYSQGLVRIVPVLAVAILSGIVPLVAFLSILLGWTAPLEGLIFVIPAVYVMVLLWVAIPVAVIERRGMGLLARSVELTAGYRWRVLFVLLLAVAVSAGPFVFLGAVEAATGDGGWGSIGYLVTEWIFSSVTSMFMAIVYAVSYHDLRVAKEGVDSDRIASVFD